MNMNCGMHDAYALTRAIIEASGGDARLVEDASDERRRVATQMLIPRTDRNVAGGDAWSLLQVREMADDREKDRLAPPHDGDARHGTAAVSGE
jgi:hypothetical protein